MPATRPRRIVRRVVMALAVVVLLPWAYLGSLIALEFSVSAGWIAYSPAIHVYAVPCNWYYRNGLPGHRYAYKCLLWAGKAGRNGP